jgi:hypothetical protein
MSESTQADGRSNEELESTQADGRSNEELESPQADGRSNEEAEAVPPNASVVTETRQDGVELAAHDDPPRDADPAVGSLPEHGTSAEAPSQVAGAAEEQSQETPPTGRLPGPEAGSGQPARVLQRTGDERVDAALARLADLDELPLAAQVTVFDDVHRLLQDALTATDAPPSAGAPTR